MKYIVIPVSSETYPMIRDLGAGEFDLYDNDGKVYVYCLEPTPFTLSGFFRKESIKERLMKTPMNYIFPIYTE